MASGLKGFDAIIARRPYKIRPSGLDISKLPDVCQRLKSRPPNFIYDKLSHDKSSPYRLLETTLSKFLPDSVNQTLQRLPLVPSCQLPAGYHLVYFPPPTWNLLHDGTDDMHFPGKPWIRRMWAGGSIEFRTDDRRKYLACRHQQSDTMRCGEQIKDAVVKGSEGNEKVWVDLGRVIGPTRDHMNRSMTEAEMLEQAAIIERRNLVFMPAKTPGEAIHDVTKPIRTIKPTIKPDFSVSMVPDANLLFRFSALTFNAHRIHLDRHSQMGSSKMGFPLGIPQMVKSITYRNMAPLFADEKMTICVRRSQPRASAASTEANDIETSIKAESTPEQADNTPVEAYNIPAEADNTPAEADSGITKWDVWIENAEGGYAVKGSAETVAAGYTSPH
ncbi:hypothetical protein V502_09737 [Pseudogymnoascus sp. VKM F-4520 (FW-2644)]|nr:hypothetical protein V502_09737 [Pseudogymnoascus sp. VKM F-4520 (FW-2644)]